MFVNILLFFNRKNSKPIELSTESLLLLTVNFTILMYARYFSFEKIQLKKLFSLFWFKTIKTTNFINDKLQIYYSNETKDELRSSFLATFFSKQSKDFLRKESWRKMNNENFVLIPLEMSHILKMKVYMKKH